MDADGHTDLVDRIRGFGADHARHGPRSAGADQFHERQHRHWVEEVQTQHAAAIPPSPQQFSSWRCSTSSTPDGRAPLFNARGPVRQRADRAIVVDSVMAYAAPST